MSYNNDQDQTGGTFRREMGAPAHRPACGAGELKVLLQRIAEHIANADERQQAALGQMQSRLAHLAEEAQSVRAVVPSEFSAAFARIEESISALTQRVATGGDTGATRPSQTGAHDEGRRDFWPEAIHGSPQEEFDAAAPQFQRPEPFWSRSGPDAPPPPLRSAASQSVFEDWDRTRTIHRPRGNEAQAVHPYSEHQEEDWDRASAEALARAYEPEPFGGVHTSQPSQADLAQFVDRQQRHTFASEQEAGRRDEGGSGDRLEERFAQIAERVEVALAQLRSDTSVTAIEARLDSFDQKLGSAMNELATRADVEKLRAVEAHISELARHVDRAQHRLARLDEIELNLSRLIEHLSDERFTQLFDQRVLSEPRMAMLAEAVAERLAERGAMRGDVGAGMDRLRELHGLIEQFVLSQRQEGEQTAGALEAIQQAVLNLLDRMEVLEVSQAPAQPASELAGGKPDWRQSKREDRAVTASSYALPQSDPIPAGNTFPREWAQELTAPPTDDSGRQAIGAEIEQARSAASSELSEQPKAETSTREEAVTVAKTDASGEVHPLRTSREEFLAAARRAARKASAQALEENADTGRAAVRQSAGSRRAAGARPVAGLVVATLAVALAVGIGVTTYSIFKGDLTNPLAFVRGGVEKGAGAAKAATGGAAEGSAAGGLSGSGAAGAPAGASPASVTTPEVIIEDPPGTPGGPESDDGYTGSRTVTTLPGSIIVGDGSLPSVISAGASPAAFTPNSGAASTQPAQSVPPAPVKRMMPPAAVGPLSLRLAAANGDPSAEFEVAVRLDEGRGVQRNLKEAVVWYQRSASRGFAPAQYRLGTLYERGLGVPADRGRAMAWYRSAAEKGNLKAMHNFAVLSASSDSADYRSAAHWFTQAAERGLVDSQYNLAVLYETGRGVDRDLKQAYKWFALAARGGDKEAMRRRDRVKWMLNANELKAAEELVRSWQPEPTEPLVNNARAAGEAWKNRERQG